MLNRTHTSINENAVEITPEKLEEIKSCINSKEGTQKSVLGMIFGSTLASFPFYTIPKLRNYKRSTMAAAIVGGLYGYTITKYFRVKDCINKVVGDNYVRTPTQLGRQNIQTKKEDMFDVNIYENGSNRLENEELVKREVSPSSIKESVFDIESSPQMSLLDEFPAMNESADVPDNKEPEKTVTYKELRQRNREGYQSRNVVQKRIWSHDQGKEQSPEINEFETESKESDLFLQQSTGKHKTKYGDVWD